MRRLPARPAARRRRRRRRQLGRGEVLTDEDELVPLEILAPEDESWQVSKNEFVTRFTLLGLPLGGDRFEIRGGHVAFANRGDIVRYDGPTRDVEIVEASGHTTFGARFETDAVAEVLDELRWRGAAAENVAGRFWLVDVPPETDVEAVEAALERRRLAGVLEWKPATGVELLPWLASQARASRPRRERVRERLGRAWSLFILPVALAAAAAGLGEGEPWWVTLLAWIAVLLFFAVLLRRLFRWLREVGVRGAPHALLPAQRWWRRP